MIGLYKKGMRNAVIAIYDVLTQCGVTPSSQKCAQNARGIQSKCLGSVVNSGTALG